MRPARQAFMKSENYEAIAFVFACLALTAVTWWCDREHEYMLHTPRKRGAVNSSLDKPN